MMDFRGVMAIFFRAHFFLVHPVVAFPVIVKSSLRFVSNSTVYCRSPRHDGAGPPWTPRTPRPRLARHLLRPRWQLRVQRDPAEAVRSGEGGDDGDDDDDVMMIMFRTSILN